ncbi:hypothetical protein [Acrocarpospora macrocephala]|nr:hypothetical protein [Acrocarpospora macrocephala]
MKRILLAGILALCGTGAVPAAVPGGEVIVAQSSADSLPVKSARAVCPSGKNVVGAGGSVGGFLPGLIMTEVVPDATLTSVTVVGREDEAGTTAQWSFYAYAVCADPLPGLELVTRTSSFSSGPVRSLKILCPAPKRALSAGGRIDGAGGEVLLTNLRVHPFSAPLPNSAYLGATEDDTGASGNWGLHGYAICADPPPGYQVVTYQSPVGSPPSQPLQGPACPTGKRVLGVGGQVLSVNGQVSLRHLIPQSLAVSVFAMEDHDGTTINWSMGGQAICAD